jgi:hypothetical protein
MGFEKKVLNLVKKVTDTPAYFYEGTLFLSTIDGEEAADVYNEIYTLITPCVTYIKVGDEIAFDFVTNYQKPPLSKRK